MQETPTMTAQTAEPLISPGTASASTNAFARLAKAAAPDAKPSVNVAGISVEQLVVDLLTPMLRDWLDQNLPGIVERVVEQEVKKLARRAELM
jgi:cell pole-organizing protein PopZ